MRAADSRNSARMLWKWLGISLNTLLLLFAIASDVMEAVSIFIEPAAVGDAGAQFHRVIIDGKREVTIKGLKSDSPLAARGFHDGDVVRFDHPWDDMRMLRAGEVVGLTQTRAGQPRRFEITVPEVKQTTLGDRIALNLNLLANLPLLLVSLFMLWRSRGDRGIIALGMAFACNGGASPYRWPLTAMAFPVWDLVLRAGFALIPWFLLRFVMNYYSNTTRQVSTRERRIYSGLVTLQVILFFLSSVGALQQEQAPVFDLLELAHNILQAVGFIISFWYLRIALKKSDAKDRQRYALLMIALVGTFLPDIVFIVTTYIINPFRFNELSSLSIVSWISQVAGSLLFAYAIFRHKVLDIGFAINRTLIYAAVSAILLAAFGLIEWAVEHVIHLDGREQSAYVDAAIAVGVFLTFHRVRDFVEHHVEALLFRDWHLNEKRLAEFVAEARFVTKQQALYVVFAREIERFCNDAECAVYALGAGGNFVLKQTTAVEAQPVIDADDAIIVKLRARHCPLELDSVEVSNSAALALPMIHRNDLQGFVLVAKKPSLDVYRPDEIQVLARAVQQIGLDIHALSMEALEGEATQLRYANALLEKKYIELASGMRSFAAA